MRSPTRTCTVSPSTTRTTTPSTTASAWAEAAATAPRSASESASARSTDPRCHAPDGDVNERRRSRDSGARGVEQLADLEFQVFRQAWLRQEHLGAGLEDALLDGVKRISGQH